MEVNISALKDPEFIPCDLSGSVLEKGPLAATILWETARSKTDEYLLLNTPEKVKALKDRVISIGMNEEEINGMCIFETNALFLQLIAGDIREAGYDHLSDIDWVDYEQQSNDGMISGSMFRGVDCEIYYTLED